MSIRTYHTIHNMFRRLLEYTQDIIVIGLCFLLFALMLKAIVGMFSGLMEPLNFQFIASELIYILVLVELYRLLIIYLQEHRIAVDIMIDVGIVSFLREIILQGILEVEPLTIVAIALLITSFMVLLRFGVIRNEEGVPEYHEGILRELRRKISGDVD
ncbi:MAG: phosphate-starvation-inducible PsiE family protein [Methanomicrobiales archaeon]|nr:phosphate-starvation-inducible PsiE family protein [Methanomicrobiales archaeon]